MRNETRSDERKRTTKKRLLLVSIFFVFAVSATYLLVRPAPVTAGDPNIPNMPEPRFKPEFQYAAKILCTANIPETSQTTPSVLPGVYQTAVNIHNPEEKTVQLQKKIALINPFAQEPGNMSKFTPDKLAKDQALSVSCEQMREILNNSGILPIHGFEGFLVIESDRSLDVTAVYTAGKVGGEVESVAVEQIRERKR